MMTRRPGSANGRPRRNRSWIKLKIAVFMPIPSARVSTASRVKPGDLRSWRIAKRRSVIGICGFGFRFLRSQTELESPASPYRAALRGNEEGEGLAEQKG